MKIAVLVTCFNRRSITVPNLIKLDRSIRNLPAIEATFFVADDASSDGTFDALKHALPELQVIRTPGDCFWTGGMNFAYRCALASRIQFDGYLLFNDDVLVDELAVSEFFESYRNLIPEQCSALVGATIEPGGDCKNVSYSGFVRKSRLRPRGVARVIPREGELLALEMPNANFMVINSKDFDSLGGLDGGYIHGHADIDLGLRLLEKRKKILLFGRPIGECASNQPLRQRLRSLPISGRFALLAGPKYSNHDFYRFCRKHYPILLFPMVVIIGTVKKFKLVFFP